MINVLNRDLNENNKYIRARGYIPAVIYGNQLEKVIPIEVYKTDFKRLIEAKEHESIIEVSLDGDIKKCLIKDVQIDGVKDEFLHIDFLLVQ